MRKTVTCDMIWQNFERSYTGVSMVAQEGGFSVCLDTQTLCTPIGLPLIVQSRSLAEGIAAEWQRQGKRILPATMPLTQLTNTAIDRMSTLQQEGLGTLLALADTDLVCYRAKTPPALVKFQQTQWQPLLDGMVQRYGVQLMSTYGVMPIKQSIRVYSILRAIISAMDALQLVALHRAATLCSSLVIAFALIDGRIGAEMAFSATQLDSLFQGAQWGIDSATAARHSIIYYELQTLAHFISLIASG